LDKDGLLPEHLFAEVLEAVGEIEEHQDKVNMLVDVASRVPDAYINAALRMAEDLPSSDSRGGGYNPRDIAISSLAGPLARTGQYRRAMHIAMGVTDMDYFGWAVCPRANAVIGMASYLPRPLLVEAVMIARSVQSEHK